MYHCQEVEFYNQCVNMRKVATGLRNIFIASLTFVMVCGTASAGDDALPFVRIVRHPVSASMGFAGVASGSETAYSSFRNSSVIPLSGDRFSTGFSYQNWAPDGVKTSKSISEPLSRRGVSDSRSEEPTRWGRSTRRLTHQAIRKGHSRRTT